MRPILSALPPIALWLEMIAHHHKRPRFQIPPTDREEGQHQSSTCWQCGQEQTDDEPKSAPGKQESTPAPEIDGQTSEEGQDKGLPKGEGKRPKDNEFILGGKARRNAIRPAF